MKKLKTILNESVLGELPSAKLFKYNKVTGKYDAPRTVKENKLNEVSTIKKIDNKKTLISVRDAQEAYTWLDKINKRSKIIDKNTIEMDTQDLIQYAINNLL
jgi:hypothetical protein